MWWIYNVAFIHNGYKCGIYTVNNILSENAYSLSRRKRVKRKRSVNLKRTNNNCDLEIVETRRL